VPVGVGSRRCGWSASRSEAPADERGEAIGAPVTGGWRAQFVQLAAILLIVFVAKGALAEPF